jgi:hypothetical protein
LHERVFELETRRAAHEPRTFTHETASIDTPAHDGELPAPEQAANLKDQVAALTQRLASLEDEETIARLAQSGSKQVAVKEIRTALDQVGDPAADPKARLAALQRLRMARQKNGTMMKGMMDGHDIRWSDIVIPMLDVAQDTRLDAEIRADVIRNFHGTRVEELRQPMLDLLASDDVPAVRVEAITALFWHLDDPTVRDVITQASQGDPHEGVQARATRILPKVQHFEREAAEAAEKPGAGEER